MAKRFSTQQVGAVWYVNADTGAQLGRFEGDYAEADARALCAQLNGEPAPAKRRAAPKAAPKAPEAPAALPPLPDVVPGAWGGEAAPKAGHVYNLSGLAGPDGVAQDVTREMADRDKALKLARTMADGGAVVTFRTPSSGEYRARVVRWDAQLRDGAPGFEAEAVGDDRLPDGTPLWGLAAQVIRLEAGAVAMGATEPRHEVAPEVLADEAEARIEARDGQDGDMPEDVSALEAAAGKPERATHDVLPSSWRPEGGGFVRLLEGDRAGVSFRRCPPRWLRDTLKAAGFRWCPDDREWLGMLADLPAEFRPAREGGAS